MTALNEWFRGIDLSRIIEWLMFALAALAAISVHESSHAITAYWLGDDTAKRMGRISLNPLRHLDVAGFVLMVVAHFGWAKPVPVDMRRFKNPKLGMALTSLAGPLSNVLLGFLNCFAFCVVLYAADSRTMLMLQGYLPASGWLYYLGFFFQICMVLNAGLAVFNLLPVSPLDGSKILAILLPQKAYYWLMRYERYGFLILIVLLFIGVLDKPLAFLREGLIDGMFALAEPIARAIFG